MLSSHINKNQIPQQSIKPPKPVFFLPPSDMPDSLASKFLMECIKLSNDGCFGRYFDLIYTEQDDLLDKLFGILAFLIKHGITPQSLREFILKNHLESVISCNSKIICAPYNNTILHLHIANENYESVNIILHAISDHIKPNVVDAEGKTLLILAAKMRNTALVKQLLNTTFSERLDINACDNNGYSALDYACMLGDIDSVIELKRMGAKLNLLKANKLAHSNSNTIKMILKSVCIEADRDIGARHNSFNFIIFSKANVENLIKQLADPDEIRYFQEQTKTFIGKSILEVCLAGQLKVQQFINNSLAHSHKTPVNGLHSFFDANPAQNTRSSGYLQTTLNSTPAQNTRKK